MIHFFCLKRLANTFIFFLPGNVIKTLTERELSNINLHCNLQIIKIANKIKFNKTD